MEKKVRVIGIGNKVSFAGKDNAQVEAVPVSICFKDDSIPVGLRADTVFVRADKVPATLTVGEDIKMEIARFRGKTRIKAIL